MSGAPDCVPWSSSLRSLAARFGERTAAYDGRERLTYAELCARAHALAGRLAGAGVKPGGYRVNPDEIEACLSAMRSCERICVTSLPSEYWGEVIVAVAERPSGDWIAESTARLQALSPHKHPRVHAGFAALPLNPQGKVNRRKLRELILATHDFADGRYPKLTPVQAGTGEGGDTRAQS